MKRILVADDDPMTCDFFREILSGLPAEIVTCQDPDDAAALATSDPFDLVISDLNFEKSRTGLDLLRAVKGASPGTEFILVTGFGTLEAALAAVREGAYDYVSKPFQVAEVKSKVCRALDHQRAAPAAAGPEERAEDSDTLLGSSPGMLEVYKGIAFVADTAANVLIHGESGTGKELVARAIHSKGPRADRPFVAVNCGALTDTLLESELFGHVKGAFTGADADRRGLFHAASGGTLFLDEIGETSPSLQVKLLRVLQEGEYLPVGSARAVRSDARVLAATNRDLEAMVRQGRFRKDLFYRLNVFPIRVPPLRERPEDIPRLVARFAARLARNGRPPLHISQAAMEALQAHPWPGNVRELENTVEQLALLSRGRPIDLEDLPEKLQGGSLALTDRLFEGLPPLAEIERRYLAHVLEAAGGNRKRAAAILGIDRRTLYRRLARLGIGPKHTLS